MKTIKFIFSSGEPVFMFEDQAVKILNSGNKIVQVSDPITGEWSGKTINLAFLVQTVVDNEDVDFNKYVLQRQRKAIEEGDQRLIDLINQKYGGTRIGHQSHQLTDGK